MKYWRSIATIAIALLVVVGAASASGPGAQSQRSADYSAAQRLLDAYIANATATPSDSRTIELIQAKGLKPTSANVGTVQRLLAGVPDVQTKINLIRLLGSLYTPDDHSKQNAAIARSLKGQISSGNQDVARAALQSYARTGYQPDSIDMLDFGLNNNLLDEDSYSQELALGLPLAPAHAQIGAASRLAATNNVFGAEVLALTINSRDVVARITPECRRILLAFLKRREPVMPMAIGQFGISDGGRYAEWLDTVAILTEASGEATYNTVVLAKLNDERVDPRKIMGYMTSAEGKRFIRSKGRRGEFLKPAAKATLLADQFPGHPVFQMMARDINTTLGELKE